MPTSRQLKRLEAVTRSPIFSHFSETLSGASVIRAYRATERFTRESLERIDKNQVFYFAGITANRYSLRQQKLRQKDRCQPCRQLCIVNDKRNKGQRECTLIICLLRVCAWIAVL